MFDEEIRRYERELLESVEPFWRRHCPDPEFGGYFTCLDRDGSVYDTEKFMWMQWRIVYQYAALCATEHRRPEWLPLALQGYEFLARHGHAEDGSYWFSLNRDGSPSLAPYEIFSECFAAMGCAALFRVTADPEHRREAEASMARYKARMDNPRGRWDKSAPGRTRRLSLGLYMILANLGIVLDECLGTDRYLPDIERAAAMVLDRFWSEEHGAIFENVLADGRVDLATSDGRHLNPGHGLEAMWFLFHHAEAAGNQAMIERCAHIIPKILERGWDPVHGGIFYFRDALGRPHADLSADMKLWWVHNEAILATLYAWRLTGEQPFLDWFRRIDEWTWARFPDHAFGEWFGYLDRRGEPTHLLKGGRWKTFFHVPRCLLFAAAQMRACRDASGGARPS